MDARCYTFSFYLEITYLSIFLFSYQCKSYQSFSLSKNVTMSLTDVITNQCTDTLTLVGAKHK